MRADGRADLRVLVLAPRGRDGPLTREFLTEAGIPCEVCTQPGELYGAIAFGEIGTVILAEESLDALAWDRLARAIAEQPAWSDLPLLIFTRRQDGALARALDHGVNLTTLERPVGRATLLSAVRSALAARRRQYELRDLLQRTDELVRRLADADRRKDEFLAALSHELRTPMAAMRNAIHLLQRTHPGEAAHGKSLSVMERQMRNLAHIVDDLLDVSRVTLGKFELARQPVDLRELATRCVQALEAEARLSRHSVTATVGDEPVVVVGDQVRLEQVLANLVTNAIKYTLPGGTIEVGVDREGPEAVMCVRDNGMGIPPEFLPKVFDLFVQGKQPLDRSKGGLGMGLTLVRTLVERHGGVVEARSDGADRGSEFWVRLPLAATHPVVVDTEGVVPPPPGLRVLVVEDNPDARDLLMAILEMWGLEVEGAGDGLTALQLALTSRPDVMVVDIGLPKLDGYEVARQIAARMGARRPHLIALTGYGQPDDKHRAMEAGFDRYLVKPVQASDLERLLREASPPGGASYAATASPPERAGVP